MSSLAKFDSHQTGLQTVVHTCLKRMEASRKQYANVAHTLSKPCYRLLPPCLASWHLPTQTTAARAGHISILSRATLLPSSNITLIGCCFSSTRSGCLIMLMSRTVLSKMLPSLVSPGGFAAISSEWRPSFAPAVAILTSSRLPARLLSHPLSSRRDGAHGSKHHGRCCCRCSIHRLTTALLWNGGKRGRCRPGSSWSTTSSIITIQATLSRRCSWVLCLLETMAFKMIGAKSLYRLAKRAPSRSGAPFSIMSKILDALLTLALTAHLSSMTRVHRCASRPTGRTSLAIERARPK